MRNLSEDVVEMAAQIEEALVKSVADERSVYPANHNRASELGHPCERYCGYSRTRGAEADLPDVGLQRIFRQGRAAQREVVRELMGIDLEWVWGERPFFDEKHFISGKLDGGIEIRHGVVVPAEIKGMQGADFDRIPPGLAGLRAMLHHPRWYIRRYPVQIALYLHLSNESQGVLVLRDKWFHRLRIVPVPRSEVSDLIDEALRRALRINEHIERGTLPDRIDYDHSICGRCSFKTICLPSRQGEGAVFVDSEELVQMLDRREALKPLVDEHATITENAKALVQDLGPEVIIGGAYVATNATRKKKRYKATGDEYETQVTTIRALEKPLVPVHGGQEKP